jgi:hypothetical protein
MATLKISQKRRFFFIASFLDQVAPTLLNLRCASIANFLRFPEPFFSLERLSFPYV